MNTEADSRTCNRRGEARRPHKAETLFPRVDALLRGRSELRYGSCELAARQYKPLNPMVSTALATGSFRYWASFEWNERNYSISIAGH